VTLFFSGWGAEGLCGGALWGAEVAVAAGAESVSGVAKVLDESSHAALRGFGELNHAVDLRAAEVDLLVVAFTPCGPARCVFGGADVAGHVDGGGSLCDEFFDCFVEGLGFHFEALAEEVGHLVVVGEDGGYAGELGDSGVVALEEEVMHLAVGEGVKEDGAGGLAVTSCASDLLVVLLDGAGERGMDDCADVCFVDAHAEGDGGDDNFEVSREEVALDALTSGRVEACVISGSAST